MEWVCEWRANKQTLIWKFVLGTRMLGPNGGGMQHHSCLWQYTRGKMKFSLSKANPSVICLWLSPEVQWSFLCLWQSPDEVLFIYGYPQRYNTVLSMVWPQRHIEAFSLYGLTPEIQWGFFVIWGVLFPDTSEAWWGSFMVRRWKMQWGDLSSSMVWPPRYEMFSVSRCCKYIKVCLRLNPSGTVRRSPSMARPQS